MTVFVFVLALLSNLSVNTAESAEPLDISSVFISPLSNPEGTGMIDIIVTKAFSRLGIKAVIVPSNRKEALEKADKGLYDGDLLRVGDIITPKYPNLIAVPETLYTFEFVAFSKNFDIPIAGWESLKPYRIGIPENAVILINSLSEQNVKALIKFISIFDMFNSLVKGETDIVIHERLMGYEQIRQSDMSSIHVLEPPVVSKPMFLYLHKKHQDLVPKVEAVFKDMKKDGTIPKLLAETLEKYKK
ncbi:MAG: amino acid ABC transporter substrate-binding protein [Desulfobacteraceae bacterium]|nr:amino acid ABC transporter substrate-binding protein [Desulfobacteraceae bacterium]